MRDEIVGNGQIQSSEMDFRGEAATGDEIEIVCAVEIDESETEFITLYWND